MAEDRLDGVYGFMCHVCNMDKDKPLPDDAYVDDDGVLHVPSCGVSFEWITIDFKL